MHTRIQEIIVFLLWSCLAACACECSERVPGPCNLLPKTGGAVFLGTVLDVDNPPTGKRDDQDGVARYHFRVDEAFGGTSESSAYVFSGRGGGDCSYHFHKGEQYLVFAYPTRNGLSTDICSRSREADLARALLPQLRAMRDGRPIASLYGILAKTQQPYASTYLKGYDQPLSHALLWLRQSDLIFMATTNEEGVFAFYGLQPGTYSIEAGLPPDLELARTILSDPLPPLKLPPSTCFERDLDALPVGKIHGVVKGPDGHALDYAQVGLFRVGLYAPDEWGWDEAQSDYPFFEFDHVTPGDYLLVFNNSNRRDPGQPFPRTFYGDAASREKAKVIHLTSGEQLLNADIHVANGYPIRKLTVRVVWESSSAAPEDAIIDVKSTLGEHAYAVKVAPGEYKLSLLREARYIFAAETLCLDDPKWRARSPSQQVDGADDSRPEITLVLPGKGCPG